MSEFSIPIVIFFFKRIESTLRIIEKISKVRPRKLYLLSDGPRNEDERNQIIECRKKVEQAINWECELVKRYSDHNIGVYQQIGEGAKWVFSTEETAIFLEDDNLPDVSFFPFCSELLEKYKDEDEILWICGTNYLGEYKSNTKNSYVFTKHLLPCGWASWARKFLKHYDGKLSTYNPKTKLELKSKYISQALYRQQADSIEFEMLRIKNDGVPSSWDFQMAYTLRINNLYGIAPVVNLIENIGADEYSTHGGKSLKNVMTARFCGIQTIPIKFPLIHSNEIAIDFEYERRIEKIILYPFSMRITLFVKKKISRMIKKIFRINETESASVVLKNRLRSLFRRKK